ncbi:hypothetical protein LWC34_10125 [Kibdelosporangium philippinense]|uniref:Uncharacterized protein n=1 Tax=Kibdelosporangium philippinense TaxID=211113 RepID=A0ABS8Z5L5_9PSEU|nr:hypothetical protein [Kibdelosporangium philippinense]MCE7003184.1 hypothetical protein [Kibdelosporangium philippinense]
MRKLIGLVVAVAAAAVASAPAAAAAPAGTWCARYVFGGHYQLGHLEYNVDIAFHAGLDVPRVVNDVTSYVGEYMSSYDYCDRYADVKALITKANSQLPRIDAVAIAGGDFEAILAEAKQVQDVYRQAESLAWAKR